MILDANLWDAHLLMEMGSQAIDERDETVHGRTRDGEEFVDQMQEIVEDLELPVIYVDLLTGYALPYVEGLLHDHSRTWAPMVNVLARRHGLFEKEMRQLLACATMRGLMSGMLAYKRHDSLDVTE